MQKSIKNIKQILIKTIGNKLSDNDKPIGLLSVYVLFNQKHPSF